MLTTPDETTAGGPRAAVLGSPVAHSLSPVMHRAAYAALGLDWRYGRYECAAPGLAPFVAALSSDWRGLSVTMPLKEAALDLAHRVDPAAREVGAANTLVRERGGWAAYNTDVTGVEAALRRAGVHRVSRVLVLGAGATTRSALRAVTDLGAAHVTLAVRATARPETLRFVDRLGLHLDVVPLAGVPDVVDRHDLVVDTLPGDAADAVAPALGGRDLPALFEVSYEGWPTPLVRVFESAGAPVASGLVMLAAQGAEQVRLMSGLDLPPARWSEVADVMLAAAQDDLAGR